MPVTLLASESDEIADLISLVRSASDPDIGLVVPHGSTALQTPLNARLLSQFSRQTGRRTAIVSADRRVQELARANGMRVYSSIPAFERGVEAPAPQPAAAPAGNGFGAAGAGAGAALGAGAAAAAASAPPAPPDLDDAAFAGALTTPAPGAVPPIGGSTRPPGGPFQPARRVGAGALNRKRLYIAGAVVGLIGLLLFFLLAASATVTVTLAGAPLSVNPTIQGSTDPTAAKAGDHILTQVLQTQGSGNFAANPTGQKTIPAANATDSVTLTTNATHSLSFQVPQGDTFQTNDHSITFVVTQTTQVCIGPSGQPPPGNCTPNGTVPIADTTAEAKGNVPANAITYWPQNPCQVSGMCVDMGQNYQIGVSNPQPTNGGADAKQETVASDADVANWNQQVTQIQNTLTSQVNTQLQGQLNGRTFAVDPSGGGKSLSFEVKPALPSSGQQFAPAQITVTGTAKAAVYNMQDVQRNLLSDTKASVSQGDQLGPNSFKPGSCQVTQASDDGTVILSCAATGFSQPVVNLEGLKSQLAGKNPGDANKIVQSKVDKVQDVEVSMFPFKLFYLPLISSRITINENFVSQPAR